MASLTPASIASRTCMSLRSSLSGWALTSSTVPGLGSVGDHLLDIDRIGLTPADQPSGRMTENVHVRILQRGTDALRLVGRREPVRSVHARHHHVQLRQQLVRIVQRAVAKDVHLTPCEEHEVRRERGRQRPHPLDLPAQPAGVQAHPEPDGGRVVGDVEIAVAERPRRSPPSPPGRPCRRSSRLGMQLAANLAELDRALAAAPAGCFDLTTVLTHSGGTQLECPAARTPPPRRGASHLAALDVLDAVLAHLDPLADGGLPQGDVVGLGAAQCCSRFPKSPGSTIRSSTRVPSWAMAATLDLRATPPPRPTRRQAAHRLRPRDLRSRPPGRCPSRSRWSAASSLDLGSLT